MSTESKLARREASLPEKTEDVRTVSPLCDIYENNDEILLVADMPGVAKDQVDVRVDKDKLLLEGRRRQPEGEGLLRCEFEPCKYSRSFVLPQSIDADKIRAELDAGVLKVHLPKTPHAKPRQIEVTTG